MFTQLLPAERKDKIIQNFESRNHLQNTAYLCLAYDVINLKNRDGAVWALCILAGQEAFIPHQKPRRFGNLLCLHHQGADVRFFPCYINAFLCMGTFQEYE